MVGGTDLSPFRNDSDRVNVQQEGRVWDVLNIRQMRGALTPAVYEEHKEHRPQAGHY